MKKYIKVNLLLIYCVALIIFIIPLTVIFHVVKVAWELAEIWDKWIDKKIEDVSESEQL